MKYCLLQNGAPGETRTPNLQVRSLLLYPIEPRARYFFSEIVVYAKTSDKHAVDLVVDDQTERIDGAPGETRTPNLQVRSLLLYPIEPRAQLYFLL